MRPTTIKFEKYYHESSRAEYGISATLNDSDEYEILFYSNNDEESMIINADNIEWVEDVLKTIKELIL